MKKIISLCLVFLFVFCAIPVNAAESGTCGEGISWSFEGGVLTISGEGKMDDMSGSAPWEDIKDSISAVTFTGGVTYVGAGAFKGCKNLTSVNFGASMYELGAESFRDCDGLTALSMPASFKVFGAGSLQSCDNLTRIDCAGRFPSFRENCLWDTYVTIYYPADRPWPVSTIKELETSFHGRVEFLSADGTDPNPPQDTTPPTTEPPTKATEAPTTAPTETTVDTTPVFTLPVVSAPIFTAPQRTSGSEEITVVAEDTDHTVLWLSLLLLLSISAAAAAVIIHSQQVKRRRQQRRRRRPQ